ncbi:MAG: 4-diphosphocytidyl-2C-methyl-D-erythritol kinase [Synergistaceae bacterium]|jgi:4-diphosphocytidyl-2-C-methyl-D-erythritol kinase|nr:4-diphosphocytidyl-2C-methyl-D-erythritol kinase [Synergistaceae bacterium]
MVFKEKCSIKINLTLRVLRKREDGYHDIHSLFWRRRSPETLEIRGAPCHDRLTVEGVDISGENLVTRACGFLRERYSGKPMPPLDMRLVKRVPVGSGIGAGSGNAAALVRWFFREIAPGEAAGAHGIALIGADVAFLASGYDLALAEGVGERLEGLGEPCGLDLPGIVMFPKWRSDTADAYAAIDRGRTRSEIPPPLTREDAREESFAVLRGLMSRKTLGRLPNDFVGCCERHEADYRSLYAVAERAGALAWGLCGSGSACFALFDEKGGRDVAARLQGFIGPEGSPPFPWLHKTLVLE